jgi:molybdenum cofactor cytidylyltransferase
LSGRLAAVLLAAGAASRYGSPKQLLRIEGGTLVRRAAEAILDTGAELMVITGAHAEPVGAELAGLPLRLLHNAAWEQGMGGSIAVGFRDLAALDDAPPASLLCLADQPLVGAAQLRRLIGLHRADAGRILVSDYGAARGPPCLFPAACYAELAALSGPAGARAVLDAHRGQVAAVPMPEAAVDIDTPQDWARLPLKFIRNSP